MAKLPNGEGEKGKLQSAISSPKVGMHDGRIDDGRKKEGHTKKNRLDDWKEKKERTKGRKQGNR